MKIVHKTSRILVLGGLSVAFLAGTMGAANAALVVEKQARHVGVAAGDDGAFYYDFSYSYKKDLRDDGGSSKPKKLELSGLPEDFYPDSPMSRIHAEVSTEVLGNSLNYRSQSKLGFGMGDLRWARTAAEWDISFKLTKAQSYLFSFDSYMDDFDSGWSSDSGFDFSLVKTEYRNGVKFDTVIFDKPVGIDPNGPPTHKIFATLDLGEGEYSIHSGGKLGAYADGPGSSNSWQQFSMSPVPEPTTWGMLALGLGVVGFAAKRRKANAASAA